MKAQFFWPTSSPNTVAKELASIVDLNAVLTRWTKVNAPIEVFALVL